MSADTAVILADAHLGRAPAETEPRLHAFLRTIPGSAEHLVIAGDLFDFWFEYRTVIPRRAFRTLAALARLRESGVDVTIIGGNHDRWGDTFWRDELGAAFHPEGATLVLAGRRVHIHHGDGLEERHLGARLVHRATRIRPAIAAFRWIHPDLGWRIARLLSGRLADRPRSAPELSATALAQERYARAWLAAHDDTDVLVLAHTHLPALHTWNGRSYVNPGAWMHGGEYAVLTPAGPELRRFADRQ